MRLEILEQIKFLTVSTHQLSRQSGFRLNSPSYTYIGKDLKLFNCACTYKLVCMNGLNREEKAGSTVYI